MPFATALTAFYLSRTNHTLLVPTRSTVAGGEGFRAEDRAGQECRDEQQGEYGGGGPGAGGARGEEGPLRPALTMRAGRREPCARLPGRGNCRGREGDPRHRTGDPHRRGRRDERRRRHDGEPKGDRGESGPERGHRQQGSACRRYEARPHGLGRCRLGRRRRVIGWGRRRGRVIRRLGGGGTRRIGWRRRFRRGGVRWRRREGHERALAGRLLNLRVAVAPRQTAELDLPDRLRDHGDGATTGYTACST